MIDTFRAKNIPYYINGVSTKLLKDNLSEKNRISDTREKISDVKHDFYENLRTIPWLDIRYNEYNNFFMCHITDERISARKLERELLDKGIMIRMCEGINGDRIRISINTKENNDLLIAALNEPSLVERSMRKLF